MRPLRTKLGFSLRNKVLCILYSLCTTLDLQRNSCFLGSGKDHFLCVSAGRSSDRGVVFVEGHPITEEEEEKRELVATFLAIVIFLLLLLLGSCGSARARRQSCSDPGLPRHLARRREKRGGGPITEIRCPRKGGGEEEVSSHVAISLLSRVCRKKRWSDISGARERDSREAKAAPILSRAAGCSAIAAFRSRRNRKNS